MITNLKITADYKIRVPVGTFICSYGFIYSRKGPDKSEDDKFKIGRIKSFGTVWENKLKGYLNEKKYGLRELARLMDCDPKTILKYDELFGINYFNNHPKVTKNNNEILNDDMMEIYKEHKANVGMVVTNNMFTKSAIELAKANNVELIDGKKLNDIRNKIIKKLD